MIPGKTCWGMRTGDRKRKKAKRVFKQINTMSKSSVLPGILEANIGYMLRAIPPQGPGTWGT